MWQKKTTQFLYLFFFVSININSFLYLDEHWIWGSEDQGHGKLRPI